MLISFYRFRVKKNKYSISKLPLFCLFFIKKYCSKCYSFLLQLSSGIKIKISNKSNINNYTSFKFYYIFKPKFTSFHLINFEKNSNNNSLMNLINKILQITIIYKR